MKTMVAYWTANDMLVSPAWTLMTSIGGRIEASKISLLCLFCLLISYIEPFEWYLHLIHWSSDLPMMHRPLDSFPILHLSCSSTFRMFPRNLAKLKFSTALEVLSSKREIVSLSEKIGILVLLLISVKYDNC